jgi:uncharacterized protein YidB (DUF937 family)
MGLADILTGMMNGPRGGPSQPSSGPSGDTSSGGGMSPLIMALLGLLAYKAIKGRSGGGQDRAIPMPPPGKAPGGTAQAGAGGLGDLLGGLLGGGQRPGAMPGGAPQGGRPGGSLADMIPGGLGGLLGGAAAGTVLSGGLENLIKGFQESGQGRTAQSWVNRGQNEEIAPGDLESALGSDTIAALSRQTGMGHEELLAGLSQQLPDFVDQLTPDGRLPTEDEASRLV